MALAAASVLFGCLADTGHGATSTFDRSRTILFDGRPTFPIALSPAPPLGSNTPWGTNGLAETVAAGVNMFRTGTGGLWSAGDLQTALAWDRAAAALHVYTWPNIGGYALATPGSAQDTGLANVVNTLTDDPSGSAIAMWKGRDEPWWANIAPWSLQFAYCRVTSRGDPAWCNGEPALDPSRLWVTIEAPRGVAADLAPYSSVTDIHGVDIYPVRLNRPVPTLDSVGMWTRTLAAASPQEPIWTTLQICASGSYDKTTGAFVLPTLQQERYMVYDAILNGARALTFFGGGTAGCFSGSDAQYGWNWTFWQSVLGPLIEQISASSPIAPALVNNAPTPQVTVVGKGTEVALKEGTSVDDLWLIAARSGPGTRRVLFRGLPGWAHRGAVYTENRTVTASRGSFRDTFNQWDVHVYHFVEPLVLRRVTPAKATVGSRVTLRGKGLAATSSVSVGGARARFKVVTDGELAVTVPRHATSGPIVVSSPLRQVTSRTSLRILPSAAKLPRISGVPRLGHSLRTTKGAWYGDPPTSYAYSWLACNPRGLGCKPVPGATRQTLRLGPQRLGYRFRAVVTVRTASGAGSATSKATRVVTR